jgi:16S rRNA (guanine966-N2)-methyltransferase
MAAERRRSPAAPGQAGIGGSPSRKTPRAGAPGAAGRAGGRAQTGGHPGEVRLIGGQWKRSRLPVPDRHGLRPTPDRVRETLFNWLGQDLSGWRVLDAFAGSGALGFEAASRGAVEVWMLERDPALVASLQGSRQRLAATAVQIRRADAMAWMARAPRNGFELVLLDPPFDAGLEAAALAASASLLVAGGWLYLESARPLPEDAISAAGLAPWRTLRAGAVHAALYQRPG